MSSDIIPAHRAVSADPQKAAGYSQKAAGYLQKAAVYPPEAPCPLADKKNIGSNMKINGSVEWKS